MKKILAIASILMFFSCSKMDLPEPVSPSINADIFSVNKSEVTDGQDIKFNLKSDGIYTLTIGDSMAGQVITRERFIGKTGENKLTLYTKTLPIASSLYLLLEDDKKTQVGKTTIIIK
jgi:hypothetical protein